MSRAIGDNELAFFGGEKAVGHIDGDALFALRSEAIDQQGKAFVPTTLYDKTIGRLTHGIDRAQDHLADAYGGRLLRVDDGGLVLLDDPHHHGPGDHPDHPHDHPH